MNARMKTLTPDEKLKLRREAARYSKDELQRFTVEELRQLCQHSLPGVRGMKKTELVETVFEWSNEDRKAAAVSTASAFLALKGLGFDPQTIEELYKAGTSAQGAAEFLQNLITVKGYKPSTITGTVLPDLGKMLRSGTDDRLQWGEDARSFLWNHYRATMKGVNRDSRDKVSINQSDLIELSESRVLGWATEKLTNLEDANWLEVVQAIIIVTGRRPAEVMGRSEFQATADRRKVVFDGQLKTKSRADVGPYEIPILVDYALLRGGLEFLDDEKRRDIPPDEVNSLSAKPLARLIARINIGLKNPKMGRDFYAAYCVKHFKPVNVAESYYLSQILGHTGSVTGVVRDVVTAESYKKVYLVD